MEWDLGVLYSSFEDEAFLSDMAAVMPLVNDIMGVINEEEDDLSFLENATTRLACLEDTFTKLGAYANLVLSTDAQNALAGQAMDRLMVLSIEANQCASAFSRRVGKIMNLEALIAKSDVLTANAFFVLAAKEKAAHQIDAALEPWLLKLTLSGGDAFSQLRDKLDATHLVSFRGEELPLSAVRGKAYDPDAAVRKDAYEAEIASYEKIALPMSYCLNSIKAEADTIAAVRHFGSVLDMTLFDAHMDRATLDAMFSAIKAFLPDFRRYLRAKGRLLGHADGLPFYDLFAPVGNDVQTYTVDEAKQILMDAFNQFNPKMADFIKNAFESAWIDMFPKPGKSGGAFCAGIHCLGISRILSNFVGSLSDISTLAHELGHAWHNECMKEIPTLLADYPMPLAETASIFNETMLSHQALKTASPEMAFTLLEAELMEATQTVVDIYSRYLFETEVIETRKDHTMSVDELKDAMLRAQEAAYGDGLQKDVRHPFMWACKSHYYNSSYNFYNFPYAFGLLFGKGVFAQYLEKGNAFVPEYNKLLSVCGSDTIPNVAASVGIDVRDEAFWRSSLAVVKDGVDRFVALCESKLG